MGGVQTGQPLKYHQQHQAGQHVSDNTRVKGQQRQVQHMGHIQGIGNKINHHHHRRRSPHNRRYPHLSIPDQNIHSRHVKQPARHRDDAGKPFFHRQRIDIIKGMHRPCGNTGQKRNNRKPVDRFNILPRYPQSVVSTPHGYKTGKGKVGQQARSLHGKL